MRVLAILCTAFLMVGGVAGCSRQAPPPPPVQAPPPPPPPSAWTEADSHAVADELIGEALKRPWIGEFRDRAGQSPQIAIGDIADHAQGAIDIPTLAAQLARALISSGRVRVVEATSKQAPDFLLQGSVGMQDGEKDGAPIKLYQIDLRLVDAKSGDPVCPVGIEKPKDDRVVEPAPAPAPVPAVAPPAAK